jgi:L-ascorbate metabolism protein UlaG (beta-lactamase superfamily)
VLLPVGAYYNNDAMQANALADEIGARVAIPMHYRTSISGFPVMPSGDFLTLRATCSIWRHPHCGRERQGAPLC